MDTADYPCRRLPFASRENYVDITKGWERVKYDEDVASCPRTDANGNRLDSIATMLA
ncbi:hypothetical protein ACNKHU_10505 [Shigella flexneri]